MSSFLSKFLGGKRTFEDNVQIPDIEPSKETFLREFVESFNVTSSSVQTDDDSDVSGNIRESRVDGKFPVDEPNYHDDSGLAMGSAGEAVSSMPSSLQEDIERKGWHVPMHFANLPYKMTAEELKSFGRRHGFHFLSVELGVDKHNNSSNLSNGSATVVVDLLSNHCCQVGEDGDEASMKEQYESAVGLCLKVFHGLDCGGRPLRVQRWVDNANSRTDARYFSASTISLKCQRCGEVGHGMRDCNNSPLPQPCHLCAGSDHDAGNCPNITCFRCGQFGHHSRDCRRPSMGRARICTFCGSSSHDLRQCPVFPGSAGFVGLELIASTEAAAVAEGVSVVGQQSRMSGQDVRCMNCNNFGHVMCLTLPKITPLCREIFCPNCGEEGHHIDFPLLGDGWDPRYCVAPKPDAFIKYPTLLRDFDRLGPNKDSYYLSLLRHAPFSDQALFPSLDYSNQESKYNLLPSFMVQGSSSNGSSRRNNSSGRNSSSGGGYSEDMHSIAHVRFDGGVGRLVNLAGNHEGNSTSKFDSNPRGYDNFAELRENNDVTNPYNPHSINARRRSRKRRSGEAADAADFNSSRKRSRES